MFYLSLYRMANHTFPCTLLSTKTSSIPVMPINTLCNTKLKSHIHTANHTVSRYYHFVVTEMTITNKITT